MCSSHTVCQLVLHHDYTVRIELRLSLQRIIVYHYQRQVFVRCLLFETGPCACVASNRCLQAVVRYAGGVLTEMQDLWMHQKLLQDPTRRPVRNWSSGAVVPSHRRCGSTGSMSATGQPVSSAGGQAAATCSGETLFNMKASFCCLLQPPALVCQCPGNCIVADDNRRALP